MKNNQKKKVILKRIGGYLHKVSPLLDESGKVIQYITSPIMVELKNKDILQIIVGATLLAIPIGFTQEVWDLGRDLPLNRVILLSALSITLIAIFVYYNFYRNFLREYFFEYLKRLFVIYFISFLVVAGMLTFIGKAPWGVDNLLAIKRILLVTFPASMSAAFGDMVK